MTARSLEAMKGDVASLLNEEWKRRQAVDTSLPDVTLTGDEVMELELCEGVAYVDFAGVGYNRRRPIGLAPKLDEPNSGIHKSADACHIKTGDQLGTFYLIVEPDANR